MIRCKSNNCSFAEKSRLLILRLYWNVSTQMYKTSKSFEDQLGWVSSSVFEVGPSIVSKLLGTPWPKWNIVCITIKSNLLSCVQSEGSECVASVFMSRSTGLSSFARKQGSGFPNIGENVWIRQCGSLQKNHCGRFSVAKTWMRDCVATYWGRVVNGTYSGAARKTSYSSDCIQVEHSWKRSTIIDDVCHKSTNSKRSSQKSGTRCSK